MCVGDGDVRLSLGEMAEDGTAEYGRLEMFFQGGWGTVCGNVPRGNLGEPPQFTNRSAVVACRQLGYDSGFKIPALVCDHR